MVVCVCVSLYQCTMFPSTLTMQGVQKKLKLLKYIEKCFGNIFLKLAELKNVLSQVVNYV